MLNSAISWVGGKRLLRKEIIPLIPKHETYCEVFGGAAWVLFGKSPEKTDWLPRKDGRYTEIYNDLNADLINFWRYIRLHPDAFWAELNNYLVSREIFAESLQREPATELERAVRFYYSLACSFSAKGKHFGIQKGRPYMPLRNPERVREAAERLRHVIIENLDFAALLKRYDAQDTFFYLDPPYFTKEGFYERNETTLFSQHDELATRLRAVKGKWLLSYNDDPYIRTLYQGFTIAAVDTTYTLSGGPTDGHELLIRNY